MPSSAAAVDSFNASVTNVQLTVGPPDVSGVERIMLAAQGDLQRLLSAFFAQPITVERVYAHTAPRPASVCASTPVTQERQVRLLIGPRRALAVVATSTVRLASPEAARLFLDEQFAIGQLFRALGRSPHFTLRSVDARVVGGKRELRRTYTLATEGVECEIEEVFPDRDMFVLGDAWLDLPAERAHAPATAPHVQAAFFPPEKALTSISVKVA